MTLRENCPRPCPSRPRASADRGAWVSSGTLGPRLRPAGRDALRALPRCSSSCFGRARSADPERPKKGAGTLVLALILGAVVAAVPVGVRQIASGKPFIHDITTDLDNPPVFVDVLPLRADAPNPPEYGGAEIAEQQRAGYPDLGPALLDRSVEDVFAAAEQTVEDLGWELVAAAASEGRIEATDTTLWYGFKDDVVLRIRREGDSTRVDARSKSRVGGSDLGKNAARIEDFLRRLEQRLND
jgi:hypothetical protein